MLKVKAYYIHPIHVICVALSVIILAVILSSNKPSDTIGNNKPEDDYLYQKDYQLEITKDGKYVIMWDGKIPITALPLDNHCNLTNAIEWTIQ